MYELKANFYPAHEPKNGYIGKADITIADAIRINGISVFQNEAGEHNIQFTEWSEGKSYVVPHNADAYASMLGVVTKAVEAENHFAFSKGKTALRMKDFEDKKKEVSIEGRSVNEKYADARYTLNIDGLCTLYGITSKYRTFEQDGKQRGFVAVDMPVQRDADGKVKMYKSADGEERAAHVFEGIEHKMPDQDGKPASIDYGAKIVDAVRAAHSSIRKQSLDSQVANADDKKAKTTKSKSTKKKDKTEPAR